MDFKFTDLAKPFPAEAVEWKAGATNSEKTQALAMAYIDSRAVMNRLDEVVGPQNWKDDYKAGPDGGVLCGISIRIGDEWVTKWDGGENSDFEAVKGGLSDAFKRAAVKWGIGRYLYDVPSQWVECVQRGKTTVLKGKPTLPAWALPDGKKPAGNNGAVKQTGNEPPAGQQTNEVTDKMTLDNALKIKNRNGDAYGDLTTDALDQAKTGLLRELKKDGLADNLRDEYQLKLEAIGLILRSRNAVAA